MATTWTEAMDAILKEMIKAAEPMRVIAARLGLNKNKVIGRSHRLGLKHPHAKNAGQRKTVKSNGDGYHYLKSQKVNHKSVIPIAEANGHEILFADRTRTQCAFIVGEIRRLETKCCGQPVHRKSWCEYHYGELFVNPKGSSK